MTGLDRPSPLSAVFGGLFSATSAATASTSAFSIFFINRVALCSTTSDHFLGLALGVVVVFSKTPTINALAYFPNNDGPLLILLIFEGSPFDLEGISQETAPTARSNT